MYKVLNFKFRKLFTLSRAIFFNPVVSLEKESKMNGVGMKLLVVAICIFAVMSCNKKEEPAVLPSAAEPEMNAVKPETKVDENSVVVSVNGKDIIQGEVEKELQNILMQYQGRVPPQQMVQLQSQFKKQAVESLINKQLLFEETDKQNIEASDEEIDAEVKKASAQFETPEKFKERLEQMGMSEEKLREDIKQNYRIEKLLKSKLSATTVTDEDINLFYKENPENFSVPEQIQASHILLSLEPDSSDEVKKEKQSELQAVLEKIKKGDDFAELARKHSDCPSKEKGGELGSFPRGAMVKAFEDVAFNLKKDEVSDVVETQFGFHIIKLTGRTEVSTTPIEQVKDKISTYLETQKQSKEVAAYLETLRSAAKIDYTESAKENTEQNS
jgi:peptidyl-prolyl cis-trans isomerase C